MGSIKGRIARMAAKQTHGAGSRWTVTLIGAPVAGVFGIFASMVLERLGWLDPPADALAAFLKANVESGALANWVGFLLFAVLYGVVLRFAWRMQPRRPASKTGAPTLPRGPTEAERNASYLEALKGNPGSHSPSLSKGDRNTALAYALGYAVHANWESPIRYGHFIMGPKDNLDGPIERFREAALAGELRVWGRRQPNGLFELIEPGFWEDNTLDDVSLRALFSQARTVPFEDAKTEGRFYDIMVNRTEVERTWPHAG
jgi:hypothetical protein